MLRFWTWQAVRVAVALAPITALLVLGPPANPYAGVAWSCYGGWFCADVLVGEDGRLLLWPFVRP